MKAATAVRKLLVFVLGVLAATPLAAQQIGIHKGGVPPVNCDDCPPLMGVQFDGTPGWATLPPCSGPLDTGCWGSAATSSLWDLIQAMSDQFGLPPQGGGGGNQDKACVIKCWDELGKSKISVSRIPPDQSCAHPASDLCLLLAEVLWIDNNGDGYHHLDDLDGSTPGVPPEGDSPLGPSHPFSDPDGDGEPNFIDFKPDVHKALNGGHRSKVLPKVFKHVGNGQLKRNILSDDLGADYTSGTSDADFDALQVTDSNNDGFLTLNEVDRDLALWSNSSAASAAQAASAGQLTKKQVLERLKALKGIFTLTSRVFNDGTQGGDSMTRWAEGRQRTMDRMIETVETRIDDQAVQMGAEVVTTTALTQSGAELTRHPDLYPRLLSSFFDFTGGLVSLVFQTFRQSQQGAHNQTTVADPVDTARGEFVHVETDLQIPGRGMDLVLRRFYRSRDTHDGVLGPNWTMPLLETHILMWSSLGTQQVLEVSWGDGQRSFFKSVATGDPNHLMWEGIGGEFGKIRMGGSLPSCSGSAGTEARLTGMGLVLRKPDGTEYWFCPPTVHPGMPGIGVAYLNRIVDRGGNVMRLRRDADGRVYRITDTLGRTVDLEYGGPRRRLQAIIDWSGRKIDYVYHSVTGDLIRVNYPSTAFLDDQDVVREDRPYISYEYAEHPSGFATNPDLSLNHNLKKVVNAVGQVAVEIGYYNSGGYEFDRVSSVTVEGRVTAFQYQPIAPGGDVNSSVSHVTVVSFPDGERERFYHGDGLLLRHEIDNGRFDASGVLISGSADPNGPSTWTTSYEYNTDYLLTREEVGATPSSGESRVKVRKYDDGSPDRFQRGNLLEEVEYSTSPNDPELTHVFAYDPVTVAVTLEIDPLGRKHRRTYAHQELDYTDVYNELDLGAWGVAVPQDTTTWGLGEVNGDCVVGGSLELIRVELPVVSVSNAPGLSFTGNVVPTRLYRYCLGAAVSASRDERGVWTNYAYSNGLLGMEVVDPGGLALTTMWERDLLGRPERVVLPDGSEVAFVYDSRDNVIESRRVRNCQQSPCAGGDIVERQFYDLVGRHVGSMEPTFAGASGVGLSPPGPGVSHRVWYGPAGLPVVEQTRRYVGAAVVESGFWHYQYDGKGLLKCTTTPDGLSTSLARDARGLVLTAIDLDGFDTQTATTKFEYDIWGDLTAVLGPDDLDGQSGLDATRFERDGYGRVRKITTPSGITQSWTLDASGKPTSSEVLRGGQVIHSSVFEYDAIDRLLVETTSVRTIRADGTVVPGQPGTVTRRAGYGALPSELRWTATDVGTQSRVTRYEYDSVGRRVAVRFGFGTEGVEEQLDELGRVTQRTRRLDGAQRLGPVSPSATVELFDYDEFGRVNRYTDGVGNSTLFELDASGRVTKKTSPEGHRMQTEYDSLGRPISVSEVGPSNGVARTVSMAYDILGRTTSFTGPTGQTTTYHYDARGRQRRRSLPNGQQQNFEYDHSGRLSSMTEFDGSSVQLERDAEGRLLQLTAAGSGSSVSRHYLYHGLSEPSRITEQVGNGPSVVVDRDYNSLGWLVEERTSFAGRTDAVRLSYDESGLIGEIVYPSGRVVNRNYDSLGRLTAVLGASAQTLATFGDLYGTHSYRHASLLGGAVQRREYDGSSRVLEQTVRASAGSVVVGTFQEFSPNGNLRARVRGSDGRREEFQYDELERLKQWQLNVSPAGTYSRQVQWIWDAADSVASVADTVGGGIVTTVNSLDQVQSALPGLQALSYSARGSEVARQRSDGATRTIQWDALGRPLECVVTGVVGSPGISVRWVHDGLDRMVLRDPTVGEDTRYCYLGDALLVSDSPTNGTREYIPGFDLREPLCQLRDGTELKYLHLGPFGNVEALHSGVNVLASFDYDPFGVPRVVATGATVASNLETDLFFLGKPYDAELGVCWLGARLYDPALGRFLSRDPLGEGVAPSLYSYAFQNPYRWADPTGYHGQSTTKPTISSPTGQSSPSHLGGGAPTPVPPRGLRDSSASPASARDLLLDTAPAVDPVDQYQPGGFGKLLAAILLFVGDDLHRASVERLTYASKARPLGSVTTEATKGQRIDIRAGARAATKSWIFKTTTAIIDLTRKKGEHVPRFGNPGRTNESLNTAARRGKFLGRALTVAAVGIEAHNIMSADPEDRARVAAQATGRLAGAYLGAKFGAAVGLATGPAAAVVAPIAAIAGGIGGAIGGEEFVNWLGDW